MHKKEGQKSTREKQNNKWNNIVIPAVAGLSEKFRIIFPSLTSQCTPDPVTPSDKKKKLVHPMDNATLHT